MVADFASLPFFMDMGGFFLTFVLIFAAIYGILWKSNFLSERKDVNAAVAFAIALITALTGVVTYLVVLIPFYIVMFIIIFAIFFLGKFIAPGEPGKESQIEKAMKSKYVIAAIVGVFLTITIVVAYQQYAQTVNEQLAQMAMYNNTTGVNLTGDIFRDTVNKYDYQCVQRNALYYDDFLCIVLNPRVLGTLIVLVVSATATFAVMYMSKEQ